MTTPPGIGAPDVTMIVVAAVAANGVIGDGGDLVWRNSEDMKRLKARTMGHTLVMGRKNFESIGRPLPGRRTVVLTRQPGWHHDGVIVVHDADAGLDEALDRIVRETGDPQVFIFGGGEIYAALMDRADELELTEIDDDHSGTVFFPEWDRTEWNEVSRDVRDGFAWVSYRRKAPRPASR